MTRLTKQREKLEAMLSDVNAFNAKSKVKDICAFLDKYIPGVEKMDTQMKKYRAAFTDLKKENGALARKNDVLVTELKQSRQQSVLKKMAELQLQHDYEEAVAVLERIPPEVLAEYAAPKMSSRQRDRMPGR